MGYDYAHAAVDDHTRLAYAEVLADERGSTCAGFLLRAVAWFATQGIDRIERVLTDNAKDYLVSRDFAAAITAIGARHKTIKPHCPWQNGKVERFNRTLQAVSPTTTNARPNWHPGSTTTTTDAVTPHSTATRPSAASCHQPDGQVHLGAAQRVRDAVDVPGAGCS